MGGFFLATNQTKRLFITGLINAVVNVIGLLIGVCIYGTAEAVAWMMVVTFYIGCWNFWYIFHYLFHSSVWLFVRVIFPGVYSMIVVGALIGFLSYCIEGSNMWMSLICKSALYCTITLLSLQFYGLINLKQLVANALGKFTDKFQNR